MEVWVLCEIMEWLVSFRDRKTIARLKAERVRKELQLRLDACPPGGCVEINEDERRALGLR